MKGKLVYEERDGLRGTRIWYGAIAVALYMCWIVGRGFYSQIVLGKPWGDTPMSDEMLILVSISMVMMIVLIFVLIDIHRLHIQIDEGSIRYMFYPYIRSFRSIRIDQIKEVYVRKYRPILEYDIFVYSLPCP